MDQPGADVVVVAAAGRPHRARLVLRAHDVNPVSQVFRERMTLEAIENGTRRVYRQAHLSRMVFPQELRTSSSWRAASSSCSGSSASSPTRFWSDPSIPC